MTRLSFLKLFAGAAVALTPLRVTFSRDRRPPVVTGRDPVAKHCIAGVKVDRERDDRVVKYYPWTGAIEEVCLDANGNVLTSGDSLVTRVRRPYSVELLWRPGHGPGTSDCAFCAPWHSEAA